MVWRAAVLGEARILLWRASAGVYAGACFLDLSRGGPVYSSCGRAGEELGLGRWPLGSETVLDPLSKRSTRQLIDFTAQPNFEGCASALKSASRKI